MSVASLAGYAPKRRFDEQAWTGAIIEGSASDSGPWTTVETFTFDDPDVDPSEPKARNFTTEDVNSDTMNFLRLVFTDADGDQDATDPIPLAPTGSFTTVANVANRLNQEFDDDQAAQCSFLIAQATVSICAALDRDPTTWKPPVKARSFLSMMATELTARSMPNTLGLQSKSERVGTYSYTETYSNSDGSGLLLTNAEELILRRVVFGSDIASVTVEGPADAYATIMWPDWELQYALYYSGSDIALIDGPWTPVQ